MRSGKREQGNLHNYEYILFNLCFMPSPEVGSSYIEPGEVRRSYKTGSRKTSVVTGAL